MTREAFIATVIVLLMAASANTEPSEYVIGPGDGLTVTVLGQAIIVLPLIALGLRALVSRVPWVLGHFGSIQGRTSGDDRSTAAARVACLVAAAVQYGPVRVSPTAGLRPMPGARRDVARQGDRYMASATTSR